MNRSPPTVVRGQSRSQAHGATFYLSGVRPNSAIRVKVGEVRHHPVETNASQSVGLELNFHHVPGVSGAREMRYEVGVPALAWDRARKVFLVPFRAAAVDRTEV